jgi:hypothetical protein
MDKEFLRRFVSGSVSRAVQQQQDDMLAGPIMMAEVTATEIEILDRLRAGEAIAVTTNLLVLTMQALAETWVETGEVPEWFKQLTGADNGEA